MSKIRKSGGKTADRLHADVSPLNVLVLAKAVSDGLGRLVDVAPDKLTVFTDESDWSFVGRDFRSAMQSIIAADTRLQPRLPFDDDERVEA
jgi:hypothetical protein